MSWSKLWCAGRRWLTARVDGQEQTIDEELMFHFRLLVDENRARGMSDDDAWRAAQNRFGSIKHYSDECRRVVLGVHPMLQNLSTAGVLVLALVVCWLFTEVRSLRQAAATPPARPQQTARLAQKTGDTAKAGREAAAKKLHDVAGTVVDHDGKPLADVHVLVILKTWPNNRYRQQDFADKTDKEGRFQFKNLVPAAGQRAVHLALVKEGYALKSTYELKKAGEPLETDALKLQLDDAVPMKLTVRDAKGRPAAKAQVMPFQRKTAAGEEHGVYFQAAEPIQAVADAQGQIPAGFFQRGDQAEIYVRLPGKEWEQLSVTIPQEGDSIEVTSAEVVDGT
ncbi:MAG TPA: permease prefix domain 1-containing protein [Pirellulales bacterium]|nr:permease prefix domain 1-containing protein [Pirellulales bacterium]